MTEITDTKELTKQVLKEIDLTDAEIELYFLAATRDVISLGELTILSKTLSESEVHKIAKKFVEKGLFKDIEAATPHYAPLPPYTALLEQLKNFRKYINDIKTNIAPQLNSSFTQIEQQAEGVKELKDYTEFMMSLKDQMLAKIGDHKIEFDKLIGGIDKIRGVKTVVSNLEKSTKQLIDGLVNDLTLQFNYVNNQVVKAIKTEILGLNDQFEGIHTNISKSMEDQITALEEQNESLVTKITDTMTSQIDGLTAQMGNIQAKISSNLQKLRLGVFQSAVDQLVNKLFENG